jgi:hypothetical protein
MWRWIAFIYVYSVDHELWLLGHIYNVIAKVYEINVEIKVNINVLI